MQSNLMQTLAELIYALEAVQAKWSFESDGEV